MFKYIKAKIAFAKFRTEIFSAFEHGDEYVALFTNLAVACKDMTPDDVKKEFITAIAEKVHEDNKKK